MALRFCHDAVANMLGTRQDDAANAADAEVAGKQTEADFSDDEPEQDYVEDAAEPVHHETLTEKRDRLLMEMAKLQQDLDDKRAEFASAGGKVEEDNRLELAAAEHARLTATLNQQLERERLKREALESLLDETRRKVLTLTIANSKLTAAVAAHDARDSGGDGVVRVGALKDQKTPDRKAGVPGRIDE